MKTYDELESELWLAGTLLLPELIEKSDDIARGQKLTDLGINGSCGDQQYHLEQKIRLAHPRDQELRDEMQHILLLQNLVPGEAGWQIKRGKIRQKPYYFHQQVVRIQVLGLVGEGGRNARL